LRDALVAAVNLNLFHKYAERVTLTNIAQMINVLQAMILTDKEKMLLTPTYHVFRMHIPFRGATSLASSAEDLPVYEFNGDSVPAISASLARGRDGKIWLSLVNLNPLQATRLEIEATADIEGASGQVLTADAMDAHNTFDSPENIKPEGYFVNSRNGRLVLDLPAKSVMVVSLD